MVEKEIKKKLLQVTTKASIEAGKEIMRIYDDPNSNFSIEKKQDNSPLTIAGRKSHEVIEFYLKESKYPILSEEGREVPFAERKNWKELWIVDPLDGTKEFIKRNGYFTVNIAFVQDGIPVLGVVFLLVTKELYFGVEEIGAYKYIVNEELELDFEKVIQDKNKLPNFENTESFVVVASKSHLSQETSDYIDKLNQSEKKS